MARKNPEARKAVAGSVPRGRTFTGCWNCRSRKVKCDQKAPRCGPCQKRGIPCSGYASKLVWVTSDKKSYQPNRRRFLPCESTWGQAQIMDSDELDYYISLCDAAQYVKNFTVEWTPESRVPFGAFSIGMQSVPPPSKLSRSLIYGFPLNDEEAFLFQHYRNHVAELMMPYVDNRNPWKSSYPAVASYHMSRNQKSLYQALIAQAAFNLVHLDCGRERMVKVATKNYTLAMQELRNNFLEQQQDYATFIASVLTLMFVEIYSGTSGSWRAHFDGAWKFLEQQQTQPWNESTFAESTTQSLCLIRIISQTSISDHDSTARFESAQDILLSTVSKGDSFGFTIGAVKTLMTCIADIRKLSQQLRFDSSLSIDDGANDIFARLNQCRRMTIDDGTPETSKHRMMARYHLNAFIAATHIYLYQTLFSQPPSYVRPYVIEVFHNIQAFFAIDDGNFSLWPAFIGAVSAYESSDIAAAKVWLERASKVGMGNRLKVKKLIEEVWRLRTARLHETGQELGSINVDWREVMVSMGLDILLV